MTDLHLLKISLGGVVGFLVWLGVTVSGGLLLVFLYFFFFNKAERLWMPHSGRCSWSGSVGSKQSCLVEGVPAFGTR